MAPSTRNTKRDKKEPAKGEKVAPKKVDPKPPAKPKPKPQADKAIPPVARDAWPAWPPMLEMDLHKHNHQNAASWHWIAKNQLSYQITISTPKARRDEG